MKASKAVIEERRRHHAALEELARSIGCTGTSGLQLWRKLRRVENTTRRVMEDYCNGTIGDEGVEKACARAEGEVRRIFGGRLPPHFHINRDPRGYALKLESPDNGRTTATKFNLHSDWGRNQILAPEIDD